MFFMDMEMWHFCLLFNPKIANADNIDNITQPKNKNKQIKLFFKKKKNKSTLEL